MTSTVEQGRQLEARVAAFFETHGYATRCNVHVDGRSGARHEIDVLAEKGDALTTYRTAIECKAWQHPIEKDVVSKLHYVLGDVGLHKGIVVSLAGCRSGAQQAAEALGIELWGPDELRRHLGDAAVGQLGVPAAAVSQTIAWGFAPTVPPERARQSLASAGKGAFGLRTLERLVWDQLMWVPTYFVRITVAQPDTRLLRTRVRSVTVDNLYEALGGAYIGTIRQAPWEQVQADRTVSLRPATRDAKVHATLRKAVESYRKVSSPAALERHGATLAGLGIPTPCESVSVEETHLVYLPYHVGVLHARDHERAVAVTAWSGAFSEPVSSALTTNLGQVRAHFRPQ